LSHGEYLLSINTVDSSFCFGIDDDKSSSSQSLGANAITDPAIEKLCEALDQDNPGKVKDALKRLRDKKLESNASQAIPKILPCLTASKPDVVLEACRTLAKIGNQDAVPALLPLLANERPDIIREACRTLADIGNKDTIPSIEPLLTNPRSDIKNEANKAIAKLRAKS
jgi:HEAT repeat protein